MVKQNIPLNERVIFALDVSDGDSAHQWITRLEPNIRFFKVGFELFLSGGLNLIKEIIDRGHKVMLDLKIYDVPATVARALQQLNQLNISLTTIHGDRAIIEAAVSAKVDVKLLAVTLLTSIDEPGAKELGITEPLQEVVVRKAQVAVDCGCAGVVASACEAQALRHAFGPSPLIVAPGIRMEGAGKDDQRRIATVSQAVRAGVDYMVIGRTIRDAQDPALAVIEIHKQIKDTLEI